MFCLCHCIKVRQKIDNNFNKLRKRLHSVKAVHIMTSIRKRSANFRTQTHTYTPRQAYTVCFFICIARQLGYILSSSLLLPAKQMTSNNLKWPYILKFHIDCLKKTNFTEIQNELHHKFCLKLINLWFQISFIIQMCLCITIFIECIFPKTKVLNLGGEQLLRWQAKC